VFVNRPPLEGGAFGTNDLGLAEVTIHLFRFDEDAGVYVEVESAAVQTDTDGTYHFDNLAAGDYRIVEDVPDGFDPGIDYAGLNTSDGLGDGIITSIMLDDGEVATDYNFTNLFHEGA